MIGINNKCKTKENKRKENKCIYPTLNDVVLFFEQNGYLRKTGEHAWNYYQDAGWKDSKGNKVKPTNGELHNE